MFATVIQRLVQMAFVMFGISVLVFLIFFATPGSDPAARIAGRNAAPETVAQIRHEFGFDRSLPVQYGVMMKRLFITRDLTSFVNRGQKVIPQVLDAVPATLSLVTGAAILWVLGGLLVGVAAAVRNRDSQSVAATCSPPGSRQTINRSLLRLATYGWPPWPNTVGLPYPG